MIPIAELQIGNRVLYNGMEAIVYSIRGPYPDVSERFNNNATVDLVLGGIITVTKGELDPILLNEEILLEFGFEKYTWCDACFIKTKHGDLMIRFFIDKVLLFFTNISYDSQGMKFKDKRYVGNTNSTQNIKYLHQLQNIYFALTGKKL